VFRRRGTDRTPIVDRARLSVAHALEYIHELQAPVGTTRDLADVVWGTYQHPDQLARAQCADPGGLLPVGSVAVFDLFDPLLVAVNHGNHFLSETEDWVGRDEAEVAWGLPGRVDVVEGDGVAELGGDSLVDRSHEVLWGWVSRLTDRLHVRRVLTTLFGHDLRTVWKHDFFPQASRGMVVLSRMAGLLAECLALLSNTLPLVLKGFGFLDFML